MSNQDGRKEVAGYIGLEKAPLAPRPAELSNYEIALHLYNFLINKHHVSPQDVLEVVSNDYPVEMKLVAKETAEQIKK